MKIRSEVKTTDFEDTIEYIESYVGSSYEH